MRHLRQGPRRPVRRLLVTGMWVALSAIAVGCSTASDPSPPSGVDGLVVPTPSPDPDDFVEEIDNPWLPLQVGATWTYDVTAGPGRSREGRASEGPDVAGVATTALRTTTTRASGRPVAETTDWFAQDRDGNVWWLGREGVWQAGEDGAGAGLAMAATPRVGDGYREALAGGVDIRSEVVDLGGSAAAPAGDFDPVVVIETTSSLEPGLVRRSFYARGTGLVLTETLEGTPEDESGLVTYDEP